MAGQGVVLGYLKYVLGFDSLAFQEGLGDADKRLKAAQRSLGKTAEKFKSIGTVMSVGITAPFTALVASSIPAARESAEAAGQVEAALTSMGDAAGRSLPQLQAQAEALMDLSTFDDDDILRKVTANMLTFGNISGEAFDRAQKAALNLSARLGQDLQSSAIQVGKALNDPVKGITALSRVGVSFTAQQKEQIKAMTAAGDAAGAQAVILGELERQFGGSAEALRKATPGIEAQQAWDSFKETLGAVALKFLPPLSSALARVLNAFNELSPGTQSIAIGFAAAAAAIGPLSYGIGTVVSAFSSLLPVLTKLAPLFAGVFSQGALAAGATALAPIAAGVAAVAAAGYLVYQNWDKIAPVLQEFWAALQAAVGPALVEIVASAKQAFNEFWNGPLGEGLRVVVGALGDFYVAYNRVLGPVFIALLRGVAQVVVTVFQQIAGAIRFLSALLRGDWGSAWTAARDMVNRQFGGLPGYVIDLMQRMVDGIRNWVVDRLGAVWDTVSKKVEAVKGSFFKLYDAVVGHSYIPDMVDQIGVHMARLQDNMVDVAQSATSRTGEAFQELGAQSASVSGQMADDFEQAAQNISSTVSNLAQAIKSGDLLSILEAVVKTATTFAGNAAKGGEIAGARANGGPVSAGRTYLVGERGPELFTARRSGYVHPNSRNAGGANDNRVARVEIVEAPGFAARVVGISGEVSIRTVGASSRASARRATRRLG